MEFQLRASLLITNFHSPQSDATNRGGEMKNRTTPHAPFFVLSSCPPRPSSSTVTLNNPQSSTSADRLSSRRRRFKSDSDTFTAAATRCNHASPFPLAGQRASERARKRKALQPKFIKCEEIWRALFRPQFKSVSSPFVFGRDLAILYLP